MYSESPVIFRLIIWKNVKERSFSSSKCLTQSRREENDAVSGELRFPYSLCFLSERPTSLPLLERCSAVLLPSEPSTAPQSTPSFLIFVDLHSGFTSGYFRSINVHVSMSCLYFNLGGRGPAWAARDAKTPSPVQWNQQTPKPAEPRLTSVSICTLCVESN